MKYTKTRRSGIQCEGNWFKNELHWFKNEFEFGNLWVSEVSGIKFLPAEVYHSGRKNEEG